MLPPKKTAPPSPLPSPPPSPPKTTASPSPTQSKIILTPRGPALSQAVVSAAKNAAKPNISVNPGVNSVKGNITKPPAQSVPAKNTGGLGRPQTSVPAKNTGGLTQAQKAQQAAAARYTQQAKQIAIKKEDARDTNKANLWTASNAAKVTKPPKFTPNKPPNKPPKFRGDPAPQFDPVPPKFTGPNIPPKFVVDEEPEAEISGGFGAGAYSAATPAPRQSLVPARDVVDFNTPPPSIEAMQQVLFEELSSFELVNMARRDTVEGLNPYYSVISNLSSIRTQYDPSKIISLQDSLQITDIYQIILDSKIPNAAYLARNNITNFFYIDTNGDFVLELDNLLPDEFVEIQIASSGKIT